MSALARSVDSPPLNYAKRAILRVPHCSIIPIKVPPMPKGQIGMKTSRLRAIASIRPESIHQRLATSRVQSNDLEELPVVFVVEADGEVRARIRDLCRPKCLPVEEYNTGEDFLEGFRPGRAACLILGAYLGGMGSFALLKQLDDEKRRLPSIMIARNADVSLAVRAMKAGVVDFIEKPLGHDQLLGVTIERALEASREAIALNGWREDATRRIADLTVRQRQIMELVLAGHPSKNIAADLGISRRTVENHRASIMRKTASKSLPLLVGLVLAVAASRFSGFMPLPSQPSRVAASRRQRPSLA